MAVSTLEAIEIDFEMHKVDSLVSTVEETAWQRISCGDGTKGSREYDWVRIHFNCPDAPGWERWLLVRRSKRLDSIGMRYVPGLGGIVTSPSHYWLMPFWQKIPRSQIVTRSGDRGTLSWQKISLSLGRCN